MHTGCNTFGYYVKDEAGNPTSGEIIWANTKAVPRGDVFDYNFNITQDQLGFFMMSNGYNRNSGLVNGDDVTFRKVNDIWEPFKGETGLLSEYSGRIPPAYAFYSEVAFNGDGIQHQVFNGNVQGWEDLYGGGDRSYNDVMFGTSIGQTISITPGDTLVGGARAENFGYVMGSDGVDVISGFDSSKDHITFYGGALSNIAFYTVEEGTYIRTTPDTGTEGGILVEGVSEAAISPRIAFDNSTSLTSSNLYGRVGRGLPPSLSRNRT